MGNFFVFQLDEQRFALYLSSVKRVVRLVEITPLPKAPDIVLGIINVQGEVVPVFDIRKRFRLPPREASLSDHIIIAGAGKRTVALVADRVNDVIEGEGVTPSEKVMAGMDYVSGVMKLDGGMVLIHDLDTFLSLAEDKILSDALKASDGGD